MWQNAHDTYLASRVLAADPIELVRMLYQAATRAVGDARRHLAAGDIAARARSITHASAVVIELATSLDHERGGSISANLARLYDYILRRLTEANIQQSDGPLAEVLGLLATLSEGWDGVQAQGVAAPARRDDAAPPPEAPKPEVSYGGSWEAPAPGEAPVSYGGSWAQAAAPEAPATNASPWTQAQTPAWEPTAAFGNSAPEPAAAWGNSREQPMSPKPEASYGSPWGQPASQEPAANVGNSWAQLAVQELAASSYGKPADSDGNAWGHLASPEPQASYSPHDWSL